MKRMKMIKKAAAVTAAAAMTITAAVTASADYSCTAGSDGMYTYTWDFAEYTEKAYVLKADNGGKTYGTLPEYNGLTIHLAAGKQFIGI